MPNRNLKSMSIEALLKLRHDVQRVLDSRAERLRDQLSSLGRAEGRTERSSGLRGRKVPVKYRDRSGNTWAGRGAQPVWLREKLKAGAKLEDFAVGKTGAPNKARRGN
jgi:DNA-binding protein H-NS